MKFIWKDIEEMIEYIADDLSICDRVYYDLEGLKSFSVTENYIYEYGEYIDIADDKEFEKTIQEKVGEGMIDYVRDLREAVYMPCRIEAPESKEKFEWMSDFIENHRHQIRFTEEAERSLTCRHPFRNFKDTVYKYDLEKEWCAFENECMEEYVRRILDIDAGNTESNV